jgi:hypothetical protein
MVGGSSETLAPHPGQPQGDGGWFSWSEGTRGRGDEGTRERGGEGARGRGDEGARERGSEGARE